MKQFEFNLESVLRLRRFAEAEARQAFAAAIAARDEAERQLLATEALLQRTTETLRSGLGAAGAPEIVQLWNEIERLEDLALKQTAILADKEREMERCRLAYEAAQLERKPLDRLKEEQRKAFHHEQDLIEQGFNDELAVLGHARKAMGRA